MGGKIGQPQRRRRGLLVPKAQPEISQTRSVWWSVKKKTRPERTAETLE